MALRTPQEYIASLQDGRVVYYKGERVKDVTSHPALSVAVKHACIDYEMAEDPTHRDLAVIDDTHIGETISRYYHLPHNSDDLLKRSKLIETATRLGPHPGGAHQGDRHRCPLRSAHGGAAHGRQSQDRLPAARAGVLPPLRHPGPGRRRGPDRREGRPRPVAFAANASRLLRAHR